MPRAGRSHGGDESRRDETSDDGRDSNHRPSKPCSSVLTNTGRKPTWVSELAQFQCVKVANHFLRRGRAPHLGAVSVAGHVHNMFSDSWSPSAFRLM